jgi:hypothetical protein
VRHTCLFCGETTAPRSSAIRDVVDDILVCRASLSVVPGVSRTVAICEIFGRFSEKAMSSNNARLREIPPQTVVVVLDQPMVWE